MVTSATTHKKTKENIQLTLVCLTGEGHGLALLEDRLLSGSSGSSTLLIRPIRALSSLLLCTGDDGARFIKKIVSICIINCNCNESLCLP